MSALRIALIALVFAVAGFGGGMWWRTVSAKPDREDIVRAFHEVFYDSHDQTWNNSSWLGVRTVKNPLDLFVFQEILYETRPDWIIEAGTLEGGSALYLATLLDVLGNGHVLTIDIENFPGTPKHDRITYLVGSSTSDEIFKIVSSRIGKNDKVMVVLDSDHSAPHVLNELRMYGPLVTKGQYLVVEDTNLNGHPVWHNHGPGPMEALETFLAEDPGFEVDKKREKFLMTFNPNGYLRKVR